MPTNIDISIPKKYGFLLSEQWDFKVLYGGRDAARGWSVSQALLASGIEKTERILCTREIQKSIKDSVHQLLSDQIRRLNMGFHYEVLTNEIRGTNGTLFLFDGLRFNTTELKSKEGVTKCWVEEANKVSKYSWNTLVPTIRADGAEIWVTFNPELESDYTYQYFVVNPPSNAKVVFSTWRDNPWFSPFSRRQMEDLKQRDPDEYLVVWEGKPRNSLQDAVYADELRDAELNNRITRVPYDPSAPVNTHWDLGYGNHTSIWFIQKVGFEWRALRFMEDSGKFLPHYVAELKKLPYIYGTHFLPHDARNNQLGGESIEKQLTKLCPSDEIEIVPASDANTGINAVRTVFSNVWFDRELCADGLQSLRHYRWKTDDQGVVTRKEPLHDQYSDGADAFRNFAMSRNRVGKKSRPRDRRPTRSGSYGSGGKTSWMGN